MTEGYYSSYEDAPDTVKKVVEEVNEEVATLILKQIMVHTPTFMAEGYDPAALLNIVYTGVYGGVLCHLVQTMTGGDQIQKHLEELDFSEKLFNCFDVSTMRAMERIGTKARH